MTQLSDLAATYRGRYFGRSRRLRSRAPVVVDAMLRAFGPTKSVIDIGCGVADLLAEFKLRGILVHGVEGVEHVRGYVRIDQAELEIADLRYPLEPPPSQDYGMAICMEVGEHIEEECVDTFLDNIVQCSGRVVLSAAPPGHEGHGHINLQPYDYWIGKMRARGYSFGMRQATEFKVQLAAHTMDSSWQPYFWNTMYFTRCTLGVADND